MRGQKIVDPKELVYRLVQIRQGIDIALGADRIYTQESVAREYARNDRAIADLACTYILENAEEIITVTNISPRGLGCIYSDLNRQPGQPYSDGRYPFNDLCLKFGYVNS